MKVSQKTWKWIGIAALVVVALYFLFRWLNRNKNGNSNSSASGSSRTNSTSCNKMASFCANNPDATWCWGWYDKICGGQTRTTVIVNPSVNTNTNGTSPSPIGNVPHGSVGIGYGGPRPTAGK